MVEVQPGAVTHVMLSGMHLIAGPGGQMIVHKARFAAVLSSGLTVELQPDFLGLQETPAMRKALDALASAMEAAFLVDTKLAEAPRGAPTPTRGIGRG